ncbi:MAG: aminotransferase class V-fold PLP-dependent enzyme, partial [bacterium]
MSIESLKKDFPIFKNQKNLVYLDNAATYHKPEPVINSIHDFYQNSYASVHRALYPLGEQATQYYEDVRNKVQNFINAQHREEIIFTKGTTEGINFIADTWAKKFLKPGDHVVLSQVEHHANLLP